MEKFQTFRRGKGKLFFVSFLALLTFNACKQEAQFPDVIAQEPTSLKVKAAMKWFEEQQTLAPVKATHFKKMQPVWAKAIVVGKVVEVPYSVDGKFYLPSLTKEFKNIGRQKLIIDNNGIKGFRSYIVSYIPTKNFRGKIQNLNILNFRHQQFDGMIRVFDLNKKPIEKYYYQNGKQSQSLSILNTRGDCYTTEWQCWEFDGEWTCRDIYVEIPCEEEEEEDDDDPCASSSPPAYCSDDDPCASPSPPAYCSDNDDPCMSAIPPPSCDGNGDPIDPNDDPCKGNNPPRDCPCSTDAKGASQAIGTLQCFPFGIVNFTLHLSNVNVDRGTYNSQLQKVPVHSNSLPALFSFNDEGQNENLNEMYDCERRIWLYTFGNANVQQEEKGKTFPYGYYSNWSFN